MADTVKCQTCTFDNEANRNTCKMCRSPLSKKAAKRERNAARQLEIETQQKEAKRQKAEKEHEKQVKRRERSKDRKQQEAEAARVERVSFLALVEETVEKDCSVKLEDVSSRLLSKDTGCGPKKNTALFDWYNGLSDKTETGLVSTAIRQTADSDKQIEEAKRLIRSELKDLSKFEHIHRLRLRLLYKYGSGECSTEEAIADLRLLDDLQGIVAKSSGWIFNAGGIPAVGKSISISGTYCPPESFTEGMDLAKHPAFHVYTHIFLHDLAKDNGLSVSKEQFQKMKDEILVLDKLEVCHDNHNKLEYTERKMEYDKEQLQAAKDLKTTVELLFTNHTTRIILQTFINLLHGKERLHSIAMSSIWNDHFKFVNEESEFASDIKTALIVKPGRVPHSDMRNRHNDNDYKSTRIKMIEEIILKTWILQNETLRGILATANLDPKALVCTTIQRDAGIFDLYEGYVEERDAAISERARANGRAGGKASMASKGYIEKDGAVKSKHAVAMGEASMASEGYIEKDGAVKSKRAVDLGEATMASKGYIEKDGEMVPKHAQHMNDEQRKKKIEKWLKELNEQARFKWRDNDDKDKLPLLMLFQPAKNRDGSYTLGRAPMRYGGKRNTQWEFIDEDTNVLDWKESETVIEYKRKVMKYYASKGKYWTDKDII
jgi:hypothetical protein